MKVINVVYTYIVWLEMVRYHNRIDKLHPNRLPNVIYNYESKVAKKGWVKEIQNHCQDATPATTIT